MCLIAKKSESNVLDWVENTKNKKEQTYIKRGEYPAEYFTPHDKKF